jgi:pentatricopeptide repeat protein
MEERTIVSWSAMIAGLSMHGQAEEALRLFSEMIDQIDMKPSEVIGSMTRDYGIIPRIEHYGCMIDLFSRAGLLQEALRVYYHEHAYQTQWGCVRGELCLVDAEFTKTLRWLKKQANIMLLPIVSKTALVLAGIIGR